MPEKEFRGDQRFGLGALLAGVPLGYAGAKVVRGTSRAFGAGIAAETRADPYAKIVSGKYKGYFQALEAWEAPIAATPEDLHEMILESFRRRIGGGGMAVDVTTMQQAVEAGRAAPGVKMLLREAFEEFAGMEAGGMGAPVASFLKPTALTTEGGAALTNVAALREFLARPELGLTREMQAGLVADLQALGELSGTLLGAKPTFTYRVVGQDKAVSELMLNFYRRGGGVTTFNLPIPSESGMMTRANGGMVAARRVLGNIEAVVAPGAEVAPVAITAPEYAIRRLREALPRPDLATALAEVQEDVSKLLITARTEEQAAGYAAQMAVRAAEPAQAIQARQALGRMGLAAGMTTDALGKGIFFRPGMEPGGGYPAHYGQAMSKVFPMRGRFEAPLFQVAPSALEEAGRQLGREFPGVGYELAVPRTDQILMAREAEGRLTGTYMQRLAIDPTAPASKRLQNIMTMLQDNKTTRDMLAGGSSVHEALTVYAQSAGPEDVARMTQEMLVQEGEVLGFTPSGAQRVKTYGMDTLIRDIETVGEETIVTTEGFYQPEKVFGPGGVKHTVEYANLAAVEKIGVRAKALEIMRMRGEHTLTGAAYEKALARAEYQAQELFAGSLGIIVEGKDWQTWTKIGAGQKNFSRFNQMLAARIEEASGRLPAEYATLPPAYQREYLLGLAAERGVELGPVGARGAEGVAAPFIARRLEELRIDEPIGLKGIGREATFTDDAFAIFKMAGWKDISESMLARTRMDAPAMHAILASGVAARATGPGGITVEEMFRQGWMRPRGPGGGVEGTIFDPRVRSRFIEETGGIIELPQEYRIQGMKVKRIAVPEFPSGHVGYYTTAEGRLIQKDLDAALRDVLETSLGDVGASATAAADLSATEPLAKYFDILGGMAREERDILGGKVAGSMRLAIGKEFLAETTQILPPSLAAKLGLAGEAAKIPTMQIAPERFEQMLSRAMGEGVLSEEMAAEMRGYFQQGRLPSVITKHPARGLGTIPVYAGPQPAGGEMIGYAASSTFANLTENLHPLLTGDLDLDPLDVDFLLTKEAMAEARIAIESGQTNQILAEYSRLEALVGDPKTEARAEGVFKIFSEEGLFSPEYLAKRAEREATAKRNVGLFNTRVGTPAAVAAESGNFTFWDQFKARFWGVNVEEAATHKIRHKLEVPHDMVDRIAENWRAGKANRVRDLTGQLFGIGPENVQQFEEEFGGVIGRLVEQWEAMGAENRQFVEAAHAGKGRAGARSFLTMADGILSQNTTAGRFVREVTGQGKSVAARAGRVFSSVFENLAQRKRTVGLALAGTAAIAALTSRPRSLTPESTTSGMLAGGSPRESSVGSPLPELKKNLHYKRGAKPGYRVFGKVTRTPNHQELARRASALSGGMPISVNVNDRRRRIHRDEIEMAMMKDPILGARRPQHSFYNRSSLSL